MSLYVVIGRNTVLSRSEKRRACIFWWEASSAMWSRSNSERSWSSVWVNEGEKGSFGVWVDGRVGREGGSGLAKFGGGMGGVGVGVCGVGMYG